MSEKEKILQLLDTVSDDRLGEILSYLQTVISDKTDDEIIDESATRILKKYHRAFEVLAQ